MVATDVPEVTREDLYEKVWSTPMSQLAKEYGLSDVGLAKICKKHKIPTPRRGYWAKNRSGKRVFRHPLRPLDDETLKTVHIAETKVESTRKGPQSEAEDPRIAALLAAERAPENQIVVAEDLRITHPLVRATKQAYAKATTDEYGRLRSRRDFNEPHLHIGVSRDNLARALRILQAMTTAMKLRGFELNATSSPGHGPCYEVLGRQFSFSIWEPSRRVQLEAKKSESKRTSWYSYRDYEYVPTGRLELHLNRGSYSSAATFRDSAKRTIEQRLNDVIRRMLQLVDEAQIQAERARIEAEAKAERRRIAVEKEIDRRSDSVRRHNLGQLAANWEAARKLEVFIEAVRAEAQMRSLPMDDETAMWLQWATDYVKQIDPLGPQRVLPMYSLTEEQTEMLRKECDKDWCGWSETFRSRSGRT